MTNPRLGLIQRAVEPDREAAREGTIAAIREAAAQGANIICLPELYDLPYFPREVTARLCRLAEEQPSERSLELGRLAGELGVVLVLPVFEQAAPGVAFNTALVFDADGALLGRYRKNHIPDGPGYHEKYYFTPGDLGFPVFSTRFGRVGVGICWDQWFPETARCLALGGAEVLLFPTAIGTEPERPDYSSEDAWRTVMRGHAIANGVFLGAVNRVGVEGGTTFYGGSFITDPFGETLQQAGDGSRILVAELDFGRIGELRELQHFFRDRRVEAYGSLRRIVPAPVPDTTAAAIAPSRIG